MDCFWERTGPPAMLISAKLNQATALGGSRKLVDKYRFVKYQTYCFHVRKDSGLREHRKFKTINHSSGTSGLLLWANLRRVLNPTSQNPSAVAKRMHEIFFS